MYKKLLVSLLLPLEYTPNKPLKTEILHLLQHKTFSDTSALWPDNFSFFFCPKAFNVNS